MSNETLLQLRSDRFRSMLVTAPSPGLTAGKLTTVGSTVGMAAEDAATGVQIGFIYQADKAVVQKGVGTGKTITQGAYVYFSSADNKVYKDSATGHRKCGIALEAAGADDTTCLIEFDGTLGLTAQTS